MDYTRGYTAAFRAAFVDPESWNDIGWFDIVSGNVNRTSEGLRHSATFSVREYGEELERWIRIYLDTEQDGSRARQALFTGIATSPTSEYRDNVINIPIQCYSVLKASEDIILPLGWYAPAGANVGRILQGLLKTTPAPKEIADTSAVLTETIIAESNENCLTMTDKILNVMGWRLQITGEGRIVISPRTEEPVISMGLNENAVIETSFNISHDFFGIPNYLRVTENDKTEVVVDETGGPLSVAERGREVQVAEDNTTRTDEEPLRAYARRRLKELQARSETVTYSRLYMPEINCEDIVELAFPRLNGNYMVTNQTISLTGPCRVDESIKRSL